MPLVLSTQTGLVSPQFHCVFDDDFDTVKKEQADTSIWKIKAHLQEAKEQVLEKSTRSSLVSAPTNQPAPPLPSYGRDLPQADRIPSTTPGAEPPRDAKDSGSARPHSTHPETSSTNRS